MIDGEISLSDREFARIKALEKIERIELDLEERDTGQPVEHTIELVKLIGAPSHVCEAASVALPGNAETE